MVHLKNLQEKGKRRPCCSEITFFGQEIRELKHVEEVLYLIFARFAFINPSYQSSHILHTYWTTNILALEGNAYGLGHVVYVYRWKRHGVREGV